MRVVRVTILRPTYVKGCGCSVEDLPVNGKGLHLLY